MNNNEILSNNTFLIKYKDVISIKSLEYNTLTSIQLKAQVEQQSLIRNFWIKNQYVENYKSDVEILLVLDKKISIKKNFFDLKFQNMSQKGDSIITYKGDISVLNITQKNEKIELITNFPNFKTNFINYLEQPFLRINKPTHLEIFENSPLDVAPIYQNTGKPFSSIPESVYKTFSDTNQVKNVDNIINDNFLSESEIIIDVDLQIFLNSLPNIDLSDIINSTF